MRDIRRYMTKYENLNNISDEDIKLLGCAIIYSLGADFESITAEEQDNFEKRYDITDLTDLELHSTLEYPIMLKIEGICDLLDKYGIDIFPIDEVRPFLKRMRDPKTDWRACQRNYEVRDIFKMDKPLREFFIKHAKKPIED